MKKICRSIFVVSFVFTLMPVAATSSDFGREVLQWRASLTTNANRLHKDIFPGIDLFYTGDTKTITSVFIVRPEADPSPIRLEFPATSKLTTDKSGSILAQTEKEGVLRILRPNIYQNLNNQNTSVAGRFVPLDDRQIGVQVGSYNKSLPLAIQFTSVFSASASSPIENPSSPLAVAITATLKDSLVGDAGQIGIVNPGDTLRYIVSITNSGTTDATGMNFSDLLDTSTVPVGSLKATPVAVNDAYVGTYNATLNVSASGVLTNDYGVPAPTATPIAAGATPHGAVTLSVDGSFAYTPTGGYFGPDSFGYTATNSVGSNSAIAAIIIPPPAPAANNDVATASGNIQISAAAPGVLGNDNLFGATITGSSTTSAQGGNVTVNADGSYTYNPLAGYEGADSFTYTITNATGSSTGTVNITVSGMIWFIDNNATAGNGRLTTPFNTLEAFRVVNNGTGNNPAANDNIFVYESATPYIPTSTLTLLAGQKLIGQDASASLSSISGVTPPAGSVALPAMNNGNGTFAIISTTAGSTNGITLGSGNTIRGLTVGPTTGVKIFGSTFGALTIGNSATPDVKLTGNGGALNLTDGSFATTSGFTSITTTSSGSQGIHLAGITGTASFGSTTVSGSTSQCILVGTTTANIDFGNTSCTGGTDGVSLQNNSAGTRTFGTLTVSGGSGNAFLHGVGGGNVVVGGTTTLSSADDAISVSTPTSGNLIDFQAATSATRTAAGGNGVSWAGTAGATMQFSGLTIQTNGGTGLNATTGGTINVTNATGTINNTVQATPAIVANGIVLNANFSAINSSGGANGVSLTSVTGTSNFGGGALSGASGGTFLVNAGTGTVTYSGTITQSNAARVVDIQNKTGGTITLGGAIISTSGTGTGIVLSNNAGATISFTGGIALFTSANAAFTATGGGIVTASQNNTSIVNTLATTTGTALNVANTTIGASGLTFRSISSNGAVSGIVLNNTGSSGGLDITGNGGPCTAATPTCTGGTIAGSTDTGISLTSTTNPSFTRMRINSSSNFGLNGASVTGMTVDACVFDGIHGNAVDEGALFVTNWLGSGSITSSEILGGFNDNIRVNNTTGTLNRLTVSGTTIRNSGNNHGLAFYTCLGGNGTDCGSVVMNLTVTGSTFQDNSSNHIDVGSKGLGSVDLVLSSNTFSTPGAGGNPALGGAVNITNDHQSHLTFDVNNNTSTGSKLTAFNFFVNNQTLSNASMVGKFRNNLVGTNGVPNSASRQGGGLALTAAGAATVTMSITGNTIRNWATNNGMDINAGDGGITGPQVNLSVTGNTLNLNSSTINQLHGISVNMGTTSTGGAVNGCVDIGGAGALVNNVVGSSSSVSGGSEIRVRQRFSSAVRLPGFAGPNNSGATSAANAVAFLAGRNTTTPGTVSVTVNATGAAGTGTFTGGAACVAPALSPVKVQ